MPKSLYIHIPFCSRKCIYCDFYSQSYDARLASEYIDVLRVQLEGLEDKFDTIYIGGGTPSILSRDLLKILFAAIRPLARRGAEYTFEINPESIDRQKAELLCQGGINRVSLGVQSFDDKNLKKIGRAHTWEETKRAISALAIFENISIDLIFGIWGQSLKDWEKDLSRVLDFSFQHVSVYGLTSEKGTPLYRAVSEGGIKLIPDSLGAKMYEFSIDFLSRAGFRHYEISNFARDGYSARHNMSYWDNNPYLGLGPSAVTYKDGVRARNVADVKVYIDNIKRGFSVIADQEELMPLARAKETAVLGIRTSQGVDFDSFKSRCGYDLRFIAGGALDSLFKQGLIVYKVDKGKKTGVRLSRRGMLFADNVCSALV